MSIFNFNKLPKAFLLTLLLITIFECIVLTLDRNYLLSDPTEGLRIRVKNKLSQTNNNFDILIFGDCYPGLGIQPKIIEQRTGLKVFNFSTYVWQTTLASYAFLRNYLKHSSKPAVILLSFNSWGAAFSKTEILQERIPFFYELTQGNTDILIEEFGLIQGLKFHIPSIAKQEKLQSILRSPFKPPLSRINEVKNFIEQIKSDRGLDPSYMDAPYNYWRMTTHKYPLSDYFQRYLVEIMELAHRNNIAVIYLKPTLPNEYFEFEEKQYHISELYDNFIASLASRYPNVTVLDLQDILSDPGYYQSKQHLNRKGSLILSEYLAAYLKKSNIWD